MSEDCPHPDFVADVEVYRLLADDGSGRVAGFSADMRVWCAFCNEPFSWIGLPIGTSPRQPMCSLDGLTLIAPLRPESTPDWPTDGPGFHLEVVK